MSPLLGRGRELVPLALSRDGATIAYRGVGYSIWVSRTNGTALHRLVRGPAYYPALSADGTLLAFGTGETPSLTISIVGTDGSGLRRVTAGPDDSDPDWSPNGDALVFTGNLHDSVIVQPLSGSRRVLARGNTLSPKWSPDGRWIAYVLNAAHYRRDLYVVRPNGTHRHRVARNANSFSWSPDGRRLAFAVPGRDVNVADVATVGVAGGRLRRLHVGLSLSYTLAWSPDGRRLILAGHVGDDPEQIWTVGRDGRGLRRVTNAGTNSVIGWTRLAPVLPPVPPIPPAERVIGARTVATDAPVYSLSADGQRVAFVPGATATDCDHIDVWTPGKKVIRRVSPGLPAPCGEGGAGAMYGLTLAGSRVAWAEILGCGNYCDVTLESATLTARRAMSVSPESSFNADEGEPWDYHLHGQGRLLVYNDGSRLVRIGGGLERCVEGDTSGARICTTLRRDAHAAPADSASEEQVAIRETDEVAVLDAQGTLLRTFPFTPEDVSVARIDRGHLVVARLVLLEEYDVATGTLELSRPLPARYTLGDFDQSEGIVLMRRPKTIMLLRLADGASLTLRPGHGPVLADLNARGLYYSYAVGRGGRLVFIPRSKLLRRLK
ncbi:MAG: hypothetical protein ABI896_03095 [Actinomycetota bacterium]